MPQTCKACKHPQRKAIDAALAAQESFRNIGKRFAISTAALFRHKTHNSVSIVRASERREMRIGESVLDEVERLKLKVCRMLEMAESDRIGFTALTRELRQTLGAIFEIQNQAVKVQALNEPPTIEVVVRDLSAEPGSPRLPQ